MTVDEFADAISSPDLQQVESGFYSNCWGQLGYFACYRGPNGYFKFSVSATESPIAPDEVAVALRAAGSWVQRAKPYSNRKGQEGFEATVHSGGHAFMLGVAAAAPRYCK